MNMPNFTRSLLSSGARDLALYFMACNRSCLGYLSAARFGHRMAAASAVEIKGTRVASDAPSHGTRQQRYENIIPGRSIMSTKCKTCEAPGTLDRRGFLSASSALGALAFVGGWGLTGVAHAVALTKAQRDKLTPDDILALMKKGNKRFTSGRREDHNYLAQQRATASGQYPLAVLLSCIDSRAPAETI